jgi:hypothetical protein
MPKFVKKVFLLLPPNFYCRSWSRLKNDTAPPHRVFSPVFKLKNTLIQLNTVNKPFYFLILLKKIWKLECIHALNILIDTVLYKELLMNATISTIYICAQYRRLTDVFLYLTYRAQKVQKWGRKNILVVFLCDNYKKCVFPTFTSALVMAKLFS